MRLYDKNGQIVREGELLHDFTLNTTEGEIAFELLSGGIMGGRVRQTPTIVLNADDLDEIKLALEKANDPPEPEPVSPISPPPVKG